MIKLTFMDQSTYWVNAEKLVWMFREGNKTFIGTQEDPENRVTVKETPEEIHMIIEEEVANMNRCARRNKAYGMD